MTLAEERTKLNEDFTSWFEERTGKKPSMVDYILAIKEGSKEVQDAAGRAFARTLIKSDGSIDPEFGKGLSPNVSMNYEPDNAFFLELEDKVDKYYLNQSSTYKQWAEKVAPKREEYQAKMLQKKRVLALESAYANRANSAKEMKELANKWENLERSGLLSQTVNISISGKFMSQLRKDPTLERYLPAKLVDNPGTKIAAPFYDEVRNFIQNNKEEYEGFFAIPGDYRKSAMNKLRTQADLDFKLRGNPEKAKQYGIALREKRMQLESARNREGLQNKKQPSKEVKVLGQGR